MTTTYSTVILYSIIVFIIRRLIRYVFSSFKDKKIKIKIEKLKLEIKQNPQKKHEIKKQILYHKFGDIRGALKFLFIDISTFIIFISIGRRIFVDLSFWALIYIVIIVSLGILSTKIKKKWGIKWL